MWEAYLPVILEKVRENHLRENHLRIRENWCKSMEERGCQDLFMGFLRWWYIIAHGCVCTHTERNA